jgi:hypothetical protein
MEVIDAGHDYLLAHLDGDSSQRLTFVKREGESYPGNAGHHEGTNMQEVLRVLIDRALYVDGQISCSETKAVVANLRSALLLLELRAARRHGRLLDLHGEERIEILPTCKSCGHIGCYRSCRATKET